MFRHLLDTFIGGWEVPGQNKNESWHKIDCCNVASYFLLEDHSTIYRPFQPAAGAVSGLWTKPQTAGEIVSFLSFRPVYVFFYQKRKDFFFIFIIFNSYYFQAIQTAVFYKKNVFKMFKSSVFMFLGLPVSCDKNKKLSLGKIDYWKVSSKIR